MGLEGLCTLASLLSGSVAICLWPTNVIAPAPIPRRKDRKLDPVTTWTSFWPWQYLPGPRGRPSAILPGTSSMRTS